MNTYIPDGKMQTENGRKSLTFLYREIWPNGALWKIPEHQTPPLQILSCIKRHQIGSNRLTNKIKSTQTRDIAYYQDKHLEPSGVNRVSICWVCKVSSE